jgi:hypothetical protein
MRTLLTATGVLVLALTGGASVRADDQSKTRALLDRFIKAQGGEKALRTHGAVIENLKGKMTVLGMDIKFTGTWSVQMPNQLRNELQFEISGKQITVIKRPQQGQGLDLRQRQDHGHDQRGADRGSQRDALGLGGHLTLPAQGQQAL